MSYSEKSGDLFAADTDAIAHGVNCKGVMGAGIAAEFSRRYPEMKTKYIERCNVGLLRPSAYFFWAGNRPLIYNLATQMFPGSNARLTWIWRSVNGMLTHAESLGIKSIGIPRIGCGIGGLKWENVSFVLYDLAEASNVALIVYTI